MLTPSASESVQRLAQLCQQLDTVVDKGDLQDVFVKSVTTKNAFEPKAKKTISGLWISLKRIFVKREYSLEKNLATFQDCFAKAKKIDAKDFATLQKQFEPDLEKMVNSLADKLEKIRDHSVNVLENQQKSQKSSRKQQKIQDKITQLKSIVFERVDVEEQCQAKLEQVLQAKVQEVAKDLLTIDRPEIRSARIQELFTATRAEVVPDGVKIDSKKLLETFTKSVEEERNAKVEALQQEIMGLLDAQDKAKSITDQLSALSIIKARVEESSELPEPEKKLLKQNIKELKSQLVLLQKQAVALPSDEEKKAVLVDKNGQTRVVTYNAEPSKTTLKMMSVASVFTQDALLKTLGYIAYDLCTKNLSSMTTVGYVLSLAAPLVAVYTANNLAVISPVMSKAKPFVLSLLTQVLAKTAAPFVAHNIRLG